MAIEHSTATIVEEGSSSSTGGPAATTMAPRASSSAPAANRMSWLVGRLSPPHVVDARYLPRYWQTTQVTRRNEEAASVQASDVSSPSLNGRGEAMATQTEEIDRTQGSSTYPIDHLLGGASSSSSSSSSTPTTSTPTPPSSSFSSTTTIDEIVKRSRNHRVIFFGEQHHQPEVLSAQLQLLLALVRDRRREHGQDARVHLVLEHFNLVEQPLLNRATAPARAPASDSKNKGGLKKGEEEEQQEEEAARRRAAARPVSSQEGFDLRHYWPLVQLARENDVKVWAGFPPRTWASLLAKGNKSDEADGDSGVNGEEAMNIGSERRQQEQPTMDVWRRIQQLDTDRFVGKEEDDEEHESARSLSSVVPPMQTAQKWSLISHVSWPYRSYLRSLFRPDEPAPPCPGHQLQPSSKGSALSALEERSGKAVTLQQSSLSAPLPAPEEKTGFLAAQALKDTYLAHVIDHVLDLPRSSIQRAPLPLSASPLGQSSNLGGDLSNDDAISKEKEALGEGQSPKDTVLVICGAGHCEWGFGAVERLRAMRVGRQEMPPLLVISKPRDSQLWVRDHHQKEQTSEDSQRGASATADSSPLTTPTASDCHHHPVAGWNRRLADFICLYDWVDT